MSNTQERKLHSDGSCWSFKMQTSVWTAGRGNTFFLALLVRGPHSPVDSACIIGHIPSQMLGPIPSSPNVWKNWIEQMNEWICRRLSRRMFICFFLKSQRKLNGYTKGIKCLRISLVISRGGWGSLKRQKTKRRGEDSLQHRHKCSGRKGKWHGVSN